MPNSVLDKIRQLDEQKTALLGQAKSEALQKANAAIAELNELGFNYRLVEGSASAVATRTPSSSTGRRSGIRDEVLSAIQSAPDGLAPAAIREQLGIESGDKSGAQSVANALSALKKANKITDKDGLYIAA